jgi:hypothetical protein
MNEETRIELRPGFFGEKERILVRHGELSASLFRFDNGVAAVRLKNGRGEFLALPFQGQQLWDARFDGKILTMRTRFDEPKPTSEYLRNYGAFLLHCGATAMGNPGKNDTHPLHGELPNAPYDTAYLLAGSDASGPYLGLGGTYRHTVAFSCDYVAKPRVSLGAGQSILSIVMEIENLGNAAMDLMYLAHVNFRPVDGGRLVYSAPCTPREVRVRSSVPPTLRPPAGYAEFLAELARDPSRHELLSPGLPFDPEVTLMLSCRADQAGWARSLMVHPDGCASYIGHRTDTLDHGIRWISRTADQDCLGLLLPATAEPDGYEAEKAKGNLKSLAAGSSVRFAVEAGLLEPVKAAAMEAAIKGLLAVEDPGGNRRE